MTILFLHGWQSVPGGVKPTFFAQHGHTVINPKLPDEDFEEAVRIAQAEFDKHQPQVVVGSSRGGAVAMNINCGDAKLVLLCPAWKKYGSAKTVKASTVILHSKGDDVVPFTDSEELVKNSDLPFWTLIEVGKDHRLADQEPLEAMLEACADEDEELESSESEDEMLEKDWKGLCYTAIMKWIRVAESEWEVVHGTVLSELVGKRIDHAWCEAANVVADLTMPVGSKLIPLERYYQVYKPENIKRYSSEEALILSISNGHPGPWD